MIDAYTTYPRRRSIPLKGYDYAQPGTYFVTICTYRRECLFGDAVDGIMVLDTPGQIVRTAWCELPAHYAHVAPDAFVIMPNHLHAIVVFRHDVVGAGLLKPAPTRRHALPEVIRGFKTFSSRRVNTWRQSPGTPVWQRNYYEHVIRDEDELNRIRQYILDNPARWTEDENHPDCLRLSVVSRP